MTELQKQFYAKCKKHDDLVKWLNEEHSKLKNIKKNVVRPLGLEVTILAQKVHGERKTNYNIESE